MEETQIAADLWRGKLVLDVGCGMGRYAKVARSLGAEVVAFDLSDALLRLRRDAESDERLHLEQGDTLRPPFAPASFDIVYSQGVLHHTVSTQRAFESVAPLVKPGGLLSIWVYGHPGSYSQFRENPLREGRRWVAAIRPLIWLVVWARTLLSDGLRSITTRLPARLLYALCFPLAALGAVPGLKFLTFSAHPDFRVRLHENFDWLAPPFQHKHTRRELAGWFERAGFGDLCFLPHGIVPKIGVLGRRA